MQLQPTLWRTCRVLANQTRLQMLRLVYNKPGLTVSSIAERLGLRLSGASEYLRALEARGLLAVRRRGRWVYYRAPAEDAGGPGAVLAGALRRSFEQTSCSIPGLLRLATAFTHPRRIQIFRSLQQQPQNLSQLRFATRISERALCRHLRKLEQRGFIMHGQKLYATPNASVVRDPVSRALTKLAGH